MRTIFRLAKPAFFRYNENFALERDLFVRDDLFVSCLYSLQNSLFFMHLFYVPFCKVQIKIITVSS